MLHINISKSASTYCLWNKEKCCYRPARRNDLLFIKCIFLEVEEKLPGVDTTNSIKAQC